MPRVPTTTPAAATATTASPAPPQSALSSLISSHTALTHTPQSPHLALALTVLHNLQYQHSWTALSLHAITTCGRLISIPTPALSSPSNSSATTATTTTTTTSNSNSNSNSTSTINTYLISGLPPKHSYIHPTLQNHLVRRRIDESRLVVQPEWVLPVGTASGGGGGSGSGRKQQQQQQQQVSSSSSWTLRRLCTVFDALPPREIVTLPSNHHHDHQKEEGEEEEEEGEEVELGVEWRDAKRVVMAMLAANGKGGDGTIVYYITHEGEVKPRPNG